MSEEIKIERNYHDNDQLMFEAYYLGFTNTRVHILHNPNGPAFKLWREDGKLIRESYWINDKSHREDGPAWKHWMENYYYEVNFINNKLVKINGFVFRFYINEELVHQI